MARKTVLITASLALPSIFLLTVGSGVAQAARTNPVLPGSVTCNAGNGVWAGRIIFSPPLLNGGTANIEKIKVVARLGSTTSPCLTGFGSPQIGRIVGKLLVSDPGTANNCATIFSGVALPAPIAPPSKFILHWTTPAGTPTTWKPPGPFGVTGSAGLNNIVINGGTVTGSFSPFAGPTATLSDASWPGVGGAVATGCASTGGLHLLTLGTSSGSW